MIPEPTPACSRGIVEIAVVASEGLTSPIPIPPTMKPASSTVQCELVFTWAISAIESATIASPPPIRSRTGAYAVSLPAIGAVKKASSVIGRKRRPACSGE